MAESMLRGIGIVDSFARLVVFCGHGCQTENNPLKAGLDCGACGGHTGEANARLAAKLLNQPYMSGRRWPNGGSRSPRRHAIRRRAAQHDDRRGELSTTRTSCPSLTDSDLAELDSRAPGRLREANGQERLSVLPGKSVADLVRRSRDWSEVRPEWGLAGNAAFIAAPRALTAAVPLDGRAFLHSYDYRNDPEFAVLEQIMTAPLVVANWINMQYYASTVDPAHFGSGNKTVHNVVGRFGVFSGNGGDLMTGLPWQSVHDGKDYQHHPLRLLAVIAAPRSAITAVLSRHKNVEDLAVNGWVQLVASEPEGCYRLTPKKTWEPLLDQPSVGSAPQSSALHESAAS